MGDVVEYRGPMELRAALREALTRIEALKAEIAQVVAEREGALEILERTRAYVRAIERIVHAVADPVAAMASAAALVSEGQRGAAVGHRAATR